MLIGETLYALRLVAHTNRGASCRVSPVKANHQHVPYQPFSPVSVEETVDNTSRWQGDVNGNSQSTRFHGNASQPACQDARVDDVYI